MRLRRGIRSKFAKLCNRSYLLTCILAIIGCISITLSQLYLLAINDEKLLFIYDNKYLCDYVKPYERTCLICGDLLEKQCKFTDLRNAISGSEPQKPKIVYFVTSAPHHRLHRKAIRLTWAKHLHPRPVFLVGKTEDHVDMNLVWNEAKLYQDIIIEDFKDSYWNLTLKTAFAMKNFIDICPDADYMVKIDDDMFFQPSVLEKILSESDKQSLIGTLVKGSSPHRNPASKFYVPYWMYNETALPPYLSGTTYVIPGQLVPLIYNQSLITPLIHLEDVFFTGLVANVGLNLALIDDLRFSETHPIFDDICIFRDYATIHRVSPLELIEFWNQLLSNTDCNTLKHKFTKLFHNYVFKGF